LAEASARWTDTLGQVSNNESQFSERVGQTEGRTDIPTSCRTPALVKAPPYPGPVLGGGLDLREVAAILGSTTGAVKVHLARGRRRLRKLLEEDDG
jgi:hypothetical protein